MASYFGPVIASLIVAILPSIATTRNTFEFVVGKPAAQFPFKCVQFFGGLASPCRSTPFRRLVIDVHHWLRSAGCCLTPILVSHVELRPNDLAVSRNDTFALDLPDPLQTVSSDENHLLGDPKRLIRNLIPSEFPTYVSLVGFPRVDGIRSEPSA